MVFASIPIQGQHAVDQMRNQTKTFYETNKGLASVIALNDAANFVGRLNRKRAGLRSCQNSFLYKGPPDHRGPPR